MFDRLEATGYIDKLTSGRTFPLLLLCEATADNVSKRVVVKLSHGCSLREKALIREAFSSFFAVDVGLPIPEPFSVFLSEEFVSTIDDDEAREIASQSSSIGFGCEMVPDHFSIPSEIEIGSKRIDQAAKIFSFDMMVGNVDRRVDKPNCLYKGDNFLIFDHECTFTHFEALFTPPMPWEEGGLDQLNPERHIFYNGLNKKNVDLSELEQNVVNINRMRIDEYEGSIPDLWNESGHASEVRDYIESLTRNVSGVLKNVERILA